MLESRHSLTGESAKQVFEDFKIDFGLTNQNLFKVAYSPLKPASVMLVGDNPGGDPNLPTTVANFKRATMIASMTSWMKIIV